MYLRKAIVILLLLSASCAVYAQDYYRFKADVTIKEKKDEEGSQLIMGQVYYDKYIKKIVYDIKFPKKVTYIMSDTTLFTVKDGQVTNRKTIPPMSQYFYFHLLLDQNLKTFGLEGPHSGFELVGTKRSEGMVISTYEPMAKLQEYFGEVLLSQKKRSLHGVAFKNNEGELLHKQIFRDYEQQGGLRFPTEIVFFNYHQDGRTHIKITKFSNVQINGSDDDQKYDYPVGEY